ncbi:MAG: hypothetical protein MPJ50_16150 [Pirellulales bacterium]|nr:hypothetical protein [Pirellulales bacterium]
MSDRQRMLRTSCLCTLVVAIGFTLGCGESSSSPTEEDAHSHSHSHSHPHPHSHSHDQASYKSARRRLLLLSRILEDVDSISGQSYAVHVAEEVGEVAGQLSMLAADTDLPEQDWIQADRVGNELARLLDTIKLPTDEWRAEIRKLQPAIKDFVESLPEVKDRKDPTATGSNAAAEGHCL